MVRDDVSVSHFIHNRRKFLRGLSGATLLSIAAPSVISIHDLGTTQAAEVGPLEGNARANRAYQIRHKAALFEKNLPLANHFTNGDDELYSHRIGSYSKALPQNNLGEVDPVAYTRLLNALTTGNPHDFETIPLGGAVKLTDPQAALAFELMGGDSHQFSLPEPPSFSSAEQAGEMVELYWQSLIRDVPFSQYDTDPLGNAAISELSQLTVFLGPKNAGRVTPLNLFRGSNSGALAGPYLSQFLWLDIPYPSTPISQRIRTVLPGIDYLTKYSDWLAVQRGASSGPQQLDPTRRFVRNGRDLAEYVHRDFTYQLFLNASLILLSFGSAALDRNNPYRQPGNQSGFSTFGAPQILDLVAKVANSALNCAWFQKWSVHRRTRPEEFGGRVHNHLSGSANYPINVEVLSSRVLNEVFSRYGTHLLPMAFPEGCPTHPAYPAGHATIAGACVTILKAFFDESFLIPNPVEATADGLSVLPYEGGVPLTIGGELDKLAYNVSLGRDFAGVHWRSDSDQGIKLGEAVSLSILTELRNCFNESFSGFSLTKFDGTSITI